MQHPSPDAPGTRLGIVTVPPELECKRFIAKLEAKLGVRIDPGTFDVTQLQLRAENDASVDMSGLQRLYGDLKREYSEICAENKQYAQLLRR